MDESVVPRNRLAARRQGRRARIRGTARTGCELLEHIITVVDLENWVRALRVMARLSLLTEADGGLPLPLPAGTRSMLLRFPSSGDGSTEVNFGAAIMPVSGQPLSPGDEGLEVELTFWAHDEAKAFVTAGASFELWYGRTVGWGSILVE